MSATSWTTKRPDNLYETALGDSPSQTSIVVSAWAPRGDWCRNICHHPALQIETANRHSVPEQRSLTRAERQAEPFAWLARHHLAALLRAGVLGAHVSGDEAERRALAVVPMVAFRPGSS